MGTKQASFIKFARLEHFVRGMALRHRSQGTACDINASHNHRACERDHVAIFVGTMTLRTIILFTRQRVLACTCLPSADAPSRFDVCDRR
jgi:hypothetical protein